MASLRFLGGALANQEIELTADAMTVGRGSSCQIQVTDAGVSSKHAKVWCENNQFYVMDLGSTNGTYVNDKDVDREALSDGDVVTLGMTKAEFHGREAEGPPRAGCPGAGRRAGGAPRAAGGAPRLARGAGGSRRHRHRRAARPSGSPARRRTRRSGRRAARDPAEEGRVLR